ncbi:MAG: RHS repeat-associated core domain-containing protein [Cyclobacteriaceae bacterium]
MRVTFTSESDEIDIPASFETDDAETTLMEEFYFPNIGETRYSGEGAVDHNSGDPDESDHDEIARVSNDLTEDSEDRIIGPSTMLLPVGPLDKIRASVQAKYEVASGNDQLVGQSAFMSALAAAFVAVTGVSDIGGAIQSNQSSILAWALGHDDATKAAAYINYIYFDKDLNYIQGGFATFDESATAGQYNPISLNGIPAFPEEGYVVVYLSYEGKHGYVDFDDFTITHTESPVEQTDSYYPFGLTFNSYQRFDAEENKFKYNGKEEQEEWGVLDYGARMYMPDLGRFFTHDRFAEKYLDLTPYHYAANNPIYYVDVNGDSLIVNGTQEAKDQFVTMMNSSLGGQATVSIGDDGLVSLESCNTDACYTDSQGAFYDVIAPILSLDSDVTEITVVDRSEYLVADGFRSQTLDMNDIGAFGDGEGLTTAGVLGHSLQEQYSKQVEGKRSYDDAHADAINAENKITGSERLPSNTSGYDGRNGEIDFFHRKNNGEVNRTTIRLTKGNIREVKRKKMN